MKITALAIIGLVAITSTTSGCAGPEKVPCNLDKKVMVIKAPPAKIVKVYVCGKCDREFRPTKEAPYCGHCVPAKVVVHPPKREVIVINPPCPPTPPTPRRGSVFVEESPAWSSTHRSYNRRFRSEENITWD